jgi:hypothetical protein
LIIAAALLAFQLHLINAGNSKPKVIDEDYEDEEDDLTTTTISAPNTTDHYQNCTFNGTVYFDDECTEWMRNFYVILSLTIVGMVGFIFAVLYCSKKFCFNRDSQDFERLVESRN